MGVWPKTPPRDVSQLVHSSSLISIRLVISICILSTYSAQLISTKKAVLLSTNPCTSTGARTIFLWFWSCRLSTGTAALLLEHRYSSSRIQYLRYRGHIYSIFFRLNKTYIDRHITSRCTSSFSWNIVTSFVSLKLLTNC